MQYAERTAEQKERDKEFVKALFEKYYPKRAKELREQEYRAKYHQMEMDLTIDEKGLRETRSRKPRCRKKV